MFFAPPNAAQSDDDETNTEIFDLFVGNAMNQSIQVAAVADLPAGTSKLVEVNRTRIALFNLDGEIYAIEDVCTHDGGPLVEGKLVNGCQIQCPRHGARFDIRTGAALSFPAFEPTRTYAVQIQEGMIWIEL
ncbi:MAG: non-heme iron oxygenase ferredoxin subunit [Caldilinea sp.]|jgi:3-phenylpropionate/trans-cinnamate dioxygenase ferredoxin subunit|nr:non-heme iron oxygenase ferredoxin subunit [Caldilinea sp.]